MGQRSRRVLVGALAWTAAVVLTGTVAWNAVAVISDDGARTGVLAPAQVSAALAAARASASASPSAGPTAAPSTDPATSPTPTDPATDPSTGPTGAPTEPGEQPSGTPSSSPGTPSTPPPPQPSPAEATWVVTGGSVTAQCTGATIRLVAATPDDGWTVEVGSPGPEHVEVELHRSGAESRVRAACSGGVPVQVADGSRSDHDSDHD